MEANNKVLEFSDTLVGYDKVGLATDPVGPPCSDSRLICEGSRCSQQILCVGGKSAAMSIGCKTGANNDSRTSSFAYVAITGEE